MKYRSWLDDLTADKKYPNNNLFSNHGNHLVPEFRAEVQDNGVIELVEDGVKNLYDEIQSHRESVELSALIERYKNGDTTVLDRRAGIYADTTKMPKTYAEILQTVIDGENIFASMPLEFREKFGNDFNQWFASGLPLPEKKASAGNVESTTKKVESEVMTDEPQS